MLVEAVFFWLSLKMVMMVVMVDENDAVDLLAECESC